jgi:chorismate mutase/prephenate dehydratase
MDAPPNRAPDEDSIRPLRDEIDAIDAQVLRLVSRRAALARDIGRLKDGGIYRAEREAEVLGRIRATNPGPLPYPALERLFREIMSACRALEQRLRIAYLGPAGTFSQQASIKHFGNDIDALPCATFDDALRTVQSAQADYAVVPVENSTEGAISRILDLLVTSSLSICGEVTLPIHQCLLRMGDSMQGIRRVHGHAQSLAQCRAWLDANLPGVERIRAASNAEGARLAAEDPDAAAIAPEIAAEVYGLTMLAPHIEDDPDNTTRFLVLGRERVPPTGHDKTSLVMSAKNQPGAVMTLLAPFAQAGISMTKLESRPSRIANWEYLFFVDIEGHRDQPDIAAALAEVEQRASMFRVLGSYPRIGAA